MPEETIINHQIQITNVQQTDAPICYNKSG